jgi:hypothetical protein
MPFATGPGIELTRGARCHLVKFYSLRRDDSDPLLFKLLLVNDDEPFQSAKRLDGIARGLYWDPLRQHFVVQKERGASLAPLERFGIDCAGQRVDIDAQSQRRIAQIEDEAATYAMSSKGDLLVRAEMAGTRSDAITAFYGANVARIESSPGYFGCPHLGCEPSYTRLNARGWSPSGDYFMVDSGLESVAVYRAADMRVVKHWRMDGANDLPAHGFLNDRAAYQFNDHSRITFQQW